MQPDATPPDDAFDSLLAEYDEALAAGRPPPDNPSPAATLDLRSRLQRARACLQRLERDRRERVHSASAGTDAGSSTTADGTWLGRFRLIRVLGAGGFAVVYLADDPLLGRKVALKVPRPEALLTPSLRHRFLREARAAARLNHGHILPVFDSGEEGPFCYLVTAYCSGGSLADWLCQRSAPVPARAAARLAADLADAVQHAHASGVLHRDLKPSNVLLEPWEADVRAADAFELRARVGDFGLAKFLEPEDQPARAPGEDDLALTRTLAFLGTPQYMAPEQAEGRADDVGPATDVYSLGTILYELLTGRPPFGADNALATTWRVAHEDVVPPRKARPDVPRDLEAICLKCLEKKPARRYAAARDLAADLRRFLDGEPTQARPASPWGRAAKWVRRRPLAVAWLGLLALGVAAFGAGAWLYARNLGEYEQARAAADHLRTLASERDRLNRALNYAADLNDSANRWKAGQREGLAQRLERNRPGPGEPDPRGFEWFYLWQQVRGPRLLGGPQFRTETNCGTSARADCFPFWKATPAWCMKLSSPRMARPSPRPPKTAPFASGTRLPDRRSES